jgi:hypothetical protein
LPKSKPEIVLPFSKPTAKRKVANRKSVIHGSALGDDATQSALSFCSEKTFEQAVHLLFPLIPHIEAAGLNVLLVPQDRVNAAKSLLRDKGIQFNHLPLMNSSDLSENEWQKVLERQEALPAFRDLMRAELGKRKTK